MDGQGILGQGVGARGGRLQVFHRAHNVHRFKQMFMQCYCSNCSFVQNSGDAVGGESFDVIVHPYPEFGTGQGNNVLQSVSRAMLSHSNIPRVNNDHHAVALADKAGHVQLVTAQ